MLDLDFQPITTPPKALPTCVWKNIILWKSPFHQTPLDLGELPFEKAVHSIYQNISFLELIEILICLNTEKITIDTFALFSQFNYRFNGKVEKLIAMWPHLPFDFRQWSKQRSLAPADLYPLTALSNASLIAQCLSHIAHLRMTRNQGTQSLELIVDCFLMGASAQDILKLSTSADEWQKHLHALRFPQTRERDTTKQNKWMSAWPKSLSTRWWRQGDRSGVEVRFVIGSKKELAEKISTLSRVYNELQDE